MKQRLPKVFSNPLSFIGLIIAVFNTGFIVFLSIIELFSRRAHPYADLIIWLVLPVFVLVGVVLLIIGISRERRKDATEISGERRLPVVDLNNPVHRKSAVIAASGFLFLSLLYAFAGYKTYEFTESETFCGTMTKRLAGLSTVLLAVAFQLLFITDRSGCGAAELSAPVTTQPFAWNQDAYWEDLEENFRKLRQEGCAGVAEEVSERLAGLRILLARINAGQFGPAAEEFGELEKKMFEVAPLLSVCGKGIEEYLLLAADLRTVVKHQSENWDMQSDAARITLYRLLYGSRGAMEELMIQAPAGSIPTVTRGIDEPSATPAAMVRNVRLHSGDILVSRGGAPTSALIARGNDFPGNFSHIAFVYVDPATQEARIVEAHIEIGVAVSTVEQYLADMKLRVMLLRPRADLPQVAKDPMLPHKAAEYAYQRAAGGHVPYDFAMDYQDHAKLFCSEVASEAYARYGVDLWAGISRISSPGLRRWLAEFGVEHFETQEPSDLEYDPQLRVVAEWRDPTTLRQDRFDNAVTEVMLEGAEKGDELKYPAQLQPAMRLVKLYSRTRNLVGKAGPIPEGMSVAAALYTEWYMAQHKAIGERLALKAEEFKKENRYEPPYWELVKLARAVKEEVDGPRE